MRFTRTLAFPLFATADQSDPVRQVTAAPAAPARVPFLDEVRGLFLTWMICAHSMTLAALPQAHPLQYLRPRGWSTSGFVMLTGFAMAWIYSRRPTVTSDTCRRLFRRSAQVAVIAIASNMAFLLARSIIEGTWTPAGTLAILTLRAPWSISALLLPIAAVIALGPALLHLTARLGAPVMFVATLALASAVDVAASGVDSPRLQSLLRFGTDGSYFRFPVIACLVLAIQGFGVGALIATRRHARYLVFAAALGATILMTNKMMPWTFAMLDGAKFLVVLGAVTVAAWIPLLSSVRAVLAVLGRFGMLTFVSHRAVVHAEVSGLGDRLAGGVLAGSLIIVTLAACVTLAWIRERQPGVGRAFRAVGL